MHHQNITITIFCLNQIKTTYIASYLCVYIIQMGGMFSCLTQDLKLQTVFGTCECAKSVCSCFAEKTDEAVLEKRIADAIKIEIGTIEDRLKIAMQIKLETFGDLPAIRVLDAAMESPQPTENAISIRIKSNELNSIYPSAAERGSLLQPAEQEI
jgi:hypothetical protein